jgi:uncharacterized protein Yka (UPF0111/DUF47 family)
MKSQIIEQLGQTDILLPSLVGEGLAANDRVKTRLSLLQAAARHARDPQGARFDLAEECQAAGIDAAPMETLINGAGLLAGERMTAPGLDQLAAGIWDDVEAMIHAVAAGDAPAGEAARQRLAALKPTTSPQTPDTLELAAIARLTAISGGQGDGLHRLVMDLHRALNKLAAEQAEEVLAGAHVYGLTPQDRPAVEAFMRGVEATRKLKFDHPGLATMATRAGKRLTMQNDLGETDAHVVVIAVEGLQVTVTYTDVHLARAKFFTGLLRNFPVQWSGLDRKSAEGLGDDGVFYLVTGRFTAADEKARDAFLEAVGSVLVFLIDWNKARKVLRNWVTKGDAVDILDWAARQRVGHRGFLELGGAELVAAAVHHATPTRIGFGERLDHALGRAAAVDFLKTVLRVSAEALLEGGSVRLARDRIEADLVRHLQRLDGVLLAIVVQQAGLARDIAAGLAQFVAERQAGRAFDRAGLAARARRIEEKADRIAIDARNEIARFEADRSIERLVNEVEQAIDELEQAAFVCPLVPDEISADLLKPLSELTAAAVAAAAAAASGAAAAADVPEGQRIDSEDALAAVARLIEAEHAGDAAERAVTAILLRGDFDLKTALSVLELTRAVERSTDRFAAFGHLLRGRVLADLTT